MIDTHLQDKSSIRILAWTKYWERKACPTETVHVILDIKVVKYNVASYRVDSILFYLPSFCALSFKMSVESETVWSSASVKKREIQEY